MITSDAISGGGGIIRRYPSFYNGTSIRKRKNSNVNGLKRSKKSVGLIFMIVIILIISSLTLAFSIAIINSSDSDESEQARTYGESRFSLNLQYQHRDTVMLCVAVPPDPLPAAAHAWNDASGVDGIYGNADDDPHCSAYCVPGSISMIAIAYGMPAIRTQQDDIYDNGKQTAPEIFANGILETHGAGMFDGSGGRAPEVQTSLLWALAPGGIGIIQHDWMGVNVPLTAAQLQTYIQNQQPVLWLDHSGWPVNQSANWPPSDARPDQGHAKVITGYNDNDTAADKSDDICLIYDPWPEYNDKSILPVNATMGPGNTYDPYWLPLNDINLSDLSDIYLVPNQTIPEFTVILIPVVGVMILVVIAMRWNSREKSE